MQTIFIAIPVLADALPEYSAESPLKQVLPENLHLTLAYLGPLEANQAQQLGEKLRQVARDHVAFTCKTESISGFPSEQAKVLALCCELSPALAALQQQIQETCESFGNHRDDHDFSPHITLARSNESMLLPAKPAVASFCIDKIVMYESRVGDKYRPLLELELN